MPYTHAMILELWPASESPGELVKAQVTTCAPSQVSDSHLGWDLRMYVSNRFPGDVYACWSEEWTLRRAGLEHWFLTLAAHQNHLWSFSKSRSITRDSLGWDRAFSFFKAPPMISMWSQEWEPRLSKHNGIDVGHLPMIFHHIYLNLSFFKFSPSGTVLEPLDL